MSEAGGGLSDLGVRRPQRWLLRLPVENYGTLLLASLETTAMAPLFADMFTPILSRLSTAVLLCRSHDRDLRLQLERAAHYDPLTDLPNRVQFVASLRSSITEAERLNLSLAVVSLDLDEFGRLNATLGENVCNGLLVALGQRLNDGVPRNGVVARLAGDEFMVMLTNLRSWDEIHGQITALLASVAEPFDIDGQSVALSSSAGVALFPADATDAEALSRAAQAAMFQAKHEARGSVRFYDAERDHRARQRHAAQGQMAAALNAGELRLYYQPQVNLPSGRVEGFEALLRWEHPQRGLLFPGSFLPLVENSEIMMRIGRWAMRQALAQGVAWQPLGIDARIAVNIAGCHLLHPNFVDDVRAALAAVPRSAPSMLEIEILESSAIENFDQARAVIAQCHALGVEFALDDFGTGYSSLAYLAQLPTNTIKIDQIFVRNLLEEAAAPAIIQAIVQIARLFGRRVIAEGVESLDHALLLLCMGCHVMQGFGFSQALPPEDVPAWIAGLRIPPGVDLWSRIRWRPALRELFREINRHRGPADGDTSIPCQLGNWIAENLAPHLTPAAATALATAHHQLDDASAGKRADHVDQLVHLLAETCAALPNDERRS